MCRQSLHAGAALGGLLFSSPRHWLVLFPRHSLRFLEECIMGHTVVHRTDRNSVAQMPPGAVQVDCDNATNSHSAGRSGLPTSPGRSHATPTPARSPRASPPPALRNRRRPSHRQLGRGRHPPPHAPHLPPSPRSPRTRPPPRSLRSQLGRQQRRHGFGHQGSYPVPLSSPPSSPPRNGHHLGRSVLSMAQQFHLSILTRLSIGTQFWVFTYALVVCFVLVCT